MTRNGLYKLTLFAALGGWTWVGFVFSVGMPQRVSGCLIKTLTGYPCPACGSTRSVLALLHGHWLEALRLNPIGWVLLAAMTVLPLWTLADVFTRNSTYYRMYQQGEAWLRRPPVFVFFLLLIILNWVWNILKGL